MLSSTSFLSFKGGNIYARISPSPLSRSKSIFKPHLYPAQQAKLTSKQASHSRTKTTIPYSSHTSPLQLLYYHQQVSPSASQLDITLHASVRLRLKTSTALRPSLPGRPTNVHRWSSLCRPLNRVSHPARIANIRQTTCPSFIPVLIVSRIPVYDARPAA
jgi:hypothetical protein